MSAAAGAMCRHIHAGDAVRLGLWENRRQQKKRCRSGDSGNCRYGLRVAGCTRRGRVTVQQEPTIICKTHVVCRDCPRRTRPIRAARAVRIRKPSQHGGRGTGAAEHHCPAPINENCRLTRSMSSFRLRALPRVKCMCPGHRPRRPRRNGSNQSRKAKQD